MALVMPHFGWRGVFFAGIAPALLTFSNIFVADKAAGNVYELTPSIVNGLYLYTQSVKLSSVIPVALAADAAGDVYVQDETSATVIEVPVNGAESTVLAGLQSPVGLALDGLGNIYSADSTNTSICRLASSTWIH